MRVFHRAISLLSCAAALACADVATAPVRPVAGCYRLATGGWRESASMLAPLPDSVRLLDVAGAEAAEAGRPLLRAYPDSLRTGYRWAWWQVEAPDTLTLVFSSDAGRVRLLLRPKGAGFGGLLTVQDGGVYAETATSWATLTPLPCEG